MVKKIGFSILILAILFISILSLVVMYKDNPYALEIHPGDITDLPIDLSDIWVVGKESIVQERKLEARIAPAGEDALSVITINARPKNLAILCKPWDVVAEGTVVARTANKSYKASTDSRLIRIEQDSDITEMVFLDYAKLYATIRIPVDLLKMNLYEETFLLQVSDSTFEARIQYLDYIAEENMVQAVLKYSDPDKELYPGMQVQATLITEKRENVIAVPLRYVEKMPNGRYRVHVVQNEVAIERFIEIGLKGEYFVEVVKGLDVGDKLISPALERSLAYDDEERLYDRGQ